MDNTNGANPMVQKAKSANDFLKNMSQANNHTATAESAPVDNSNKKLVQTNELLDVSVKLGASDIHIAEDQPIMFRIGGKLAKISGIDKLDKEQMEHIIFTLVGEDKKELVYKQRDLDFSYKHNDGNMFRVNIFFKRKKLAAVMRLIEKNIRSFDQLSLPKLAESFLRQKQGLIMITGPTGSGKTTSLSAMIDWINERFPYHIITVEDPIEVIFEPKKSVISQRELNSDTNTMGNALKGILRQDPDVVVIAEMRDPETISAAITISETGHLVFGTLHTSGADQTVSRIANAFPPVQQQQILDKLADSLVGVISQRLVPKIGGGRIPLFEIFENTPGIAHLIRSGDFTQIKNAMTTGGNKGMFTMQMYAEKLIQDEKVDREDIKWLFEEDEDLRKEE